MSSQNSYVEPPIALVLGNEDFRRGLVQQGRALMNERQ